MGPSSSVPLFRIFGIRLELHATFFLLLIYVSLIGYRADAVFGLSWTLANLLVVFTCIVLHELGHSLTARLFGIHTERILLLPIGGIAQMSVIPRDSKKELSITFAGPAVNFIIAGFIACLLYLSNATFRLESIQNELNQYSFTGFIWMILIFNLFMGTFNFLPIFPMDGGRILRALLGFKLSYLRATQIVMWVSKPLSLILMALALYNHAWMPAILFITIFILGELEWRVIKRRERYQDLPVRILTARFIHIYPPNITLKEALDVMQFEQPREIVVGTQSDILGICTFEQLADLVQLTPPHAELLRYLKKPTRLQAHWPLSALGRQLESSSSQHFTVYENEEFLGILRLADLDRLLVWHRLRQRASGLPTTNPAQRLT